LAIPGGIFKGKKQQGRKNAKNTCLKKRKKLNNKKKINI